MKCHDTYITYLQMVQPKNYINLYRIHVCMNIYIHVYALYMYIDGEKI